MTSFVHVHTWANWIAVGDRTNTAVPWHAGLTVEDLTPLSMLGRSGLTAHRNGVIVAPDARAITPVSPEDHVDFAVRPADPATITAALVSALVSAAVGFVISLILPKPKGPKKRGDEESPTYGWQGSDNVRTEGQPRQVVYGEIRVAPQVLDEFVRTQTAPPKSDLYMLLGIGEGAIYAIGNRLTDSPALTPLSTEDEENPLPRGIEIESNTATNFNGIECGVRLGTREQEPLFGFEQVHTLSTVGQALLQAETTASSNAATAWNLTTFPFNSNDATVQAIWDEFAQGFDLPSAADLIVATVDFPEGLYKLDSSGSLQDANFQALMRYRELDGGGSPIVTGGDNGDGWVYVAPYEVLRAHHQSAFSYELAATMRTSAGYTPGTPGRILDANSAGMYAVTAASAGGAAANASTPWTAGTAVSAFTVEGWFRPETLPLTGTGASTVRSIFEWASTSGGPRGVSLALYRETVPIADTTEQRWRLRVYYGDGSGSHEFQRDIGVTPGTSGDLTNWSAGVWRHVAVTYSSANSGRLRIYLDGVRFQNFTGIGDLRAPAAPMYLGRTSLTPAGAQAGVGRFDEWRVWSTERTAQQIISAYGARAGQFGSSSADLVAGWHFDGPDVLTAYTYSNDFGTRNNDVTQVGGATMGDPTTANLSVVYRPGGGVQKRARYRVQLMRFNVLSTSTFIGDRSEWTSLDGIIDEQLAYPNTAVVSLKIPATDQLNTSTPRVTLAVKGRTVPVWDGVSTVAPNVTEAWSANPAWICLDILTNRRYGRGGDYSLQDIDLPSLKEWADYCDELIYDAKGSTAIHSSTSSFSIANLKYDSTLFSSTGGIEISFRTGFTPPTHWVVGGHLGFAGIPAPPTAGLLVDINAIPGFEIGTMTFASSAWTVTIKYPTATYGAPWLDGAFLSTVINPTAVTGNVQGREVRFRFDGVFDTFGKVWDQLLLVAGTARATPVLEGRRIRFRVARPRSPVGIVTMASIIPDTFTIQYTGPAERPNAYTADFLDADRNWQRATAERTAASVQSVVPEGAFNRENVELFGITRRSQVLRDLDFRLAVNALLVRQGSFRTGMQALPYESGDVVVLSHDLVPWGKGGRFAGTVTGTTIELERAVTLAASTTYYLDVRFNSHGQTGSGSTTADYMETREVTSAAGTYAAGDSLTIASAFTFDPVKDDEYVLYSLAERKLAEIAEITSAQDGTRAVTWIEYQDDTFDVDTLPQDIPTELQFATQAPPTTPDAIPGAVLDLSVREQQSADASGRWEPLLRVSWRLDPDTTEHVSEVAVLLRRDEQDAFEEVARLRGPATSATLRSGGAPGTSLEVAVQPVTTRGKRMAPLLCARASAVVSGLHIAPPPPTNLRAVFDGDRATYLWDPPSNARGLSYELRRGGWKLGQHIGIAPEGSTSFGPTVNWAAATDNANGDGPPQVLVRSRDSRGHYSTAAILEGFDPVVAGAEVLVPPNVLGRRINGDQRWEDYGAGWSGGFPATTLTDLEVHTLVDGREVLRFLGSALTGTFETAVGTIDADSRPERAYVEAFAIADQLPPLTADDETFGADDPAASRLTAEGSLVALPGESTGVSLAVEWRYKLTPASAYTDWQAFVPGLYYFTAPQFRLRLTRPDDTWDAWIYSFGTRLSRVAPQKFQKTAVHAALEASALSLG